jgi:hypothetical protein
VQVKYSTIEHRPYRTYLVCFHWRDFTEQYKFRWWFDMFLLKVYSFALLFIVMAAIMASVLLMGFPYFRLPAQACLLNRVFSRKPNRQLQKLLDWFSVFMQSVEDFM